jgi:two-component system sporulation sensor kinase C
LAHFYLSKYNKRLELKNCCLNSIVKTSLVLMQAYATTCNVFIKLELGNVPELNLDENEIRHLLLNLIRNGIEAMSSGGELTISTGVEQGNVFLSVKDKGSGISSHILDKLGTPFLTTKDTGNTGTGLGLPTCYRIANRHNASINIKTGNLGTTFSVCFSHCLTA